MVVVFWHQGEYYHGVKGHKMILDCASSIGDELGVTTPKAIKTHSNGKPYFSDSPLHFSLSHSEDLWACAFSDSEIGLDVQYKKEKNYIRTAQRMFTENERTYIVERSATYADAFYKIWTRMEAFAKCTGEGIFAERPDLADSDGKLLDQVNWKDEPYYFANFEIEDIAGGQSNRFASALCSKAPVNKALTKVKEIKDLDEI